MRGQMLGVRSMLNGTCRSSGPSDSLAPPPSPYPAHVDPSPVDSNGTESTEIEDEKQDEVKSPVPEQSEELQSPDIEITSPQSLGSVRSLPIWKSSGMIC